MTLSEMDGKSSTQGNKELKLLNHKSFSERVKSAFFETVCFIGLPPNQNESPRVALLRMILVEVRWLLQLLPYLESEETLNNGAVVHGFWFIISCIRPDMIMSYFELAWAWMILVWVGVIACWLLFALVFAFTFLNRTTHPRLRKLLQVFGQLLLSLISIPSANILLATWFPDSRFGNGISDSLRAWAGYMSLMVYVGLVCFQCTMIIANFEPDMTLRLLRGKGEMDQDFLTLVVAQTVMVSYYVLFSSHRLMHNALVLCLSLPLTLHYYTHLPHYRSLANAVAAWSRTALTWSAFAMLIGQSISPLCSLLLIATVNVSLGVILALGFDSYQNRRIFDFSRRLHDNLRVYEYSLGIRYYIFRAMDETDPQRRTTLGELAVSKVDLALKHCAETDRKTLILIKYLVYLNLLRNERGARVSLSQAVMLKSSLTSSFLEFKAKWMLSASSELEEIVFLRYLEKLAGVKERDEQLCIRLSELWSELGSRYPNQTRLRKLSTVVYTEVKFLKQEFNSLVKNFPGGYELYDLYKSFVSDVLGKTEKAEVLERKAKYILEETKKLEMKDEVEAVKFFDPLVGIVLIDTHSRNFGGILYMNEAASSLLGFDLKSLQLCKLTNLIPPPYNSNHLKLIRTFINSSNATSVDHPGMLPLFTSTGFIVFCSVKLYLTSNNGLPIIALAFKQVKSLKEGAIITKEGVIEAHTSDFPRHVGYIDSSIKHVEGDDLSEKRRSFFEHRNTLGVSKGFEMFANRSYSGMFSVAEYCNKPVYYFFVFESGEI